MAFWSLEVKAGETCEVQLGKGKFVHLDQASIVEYGVDADEAVTLRLVVDGRKIVLATLNTKLLPTETFNLLFYGTFQLSHSMKTASVYFCGNMYEKNGGVQESRKKEEGNFSKKRKRVRIYQECGTEIGGTVISSSSDSDDDRCPSPLARM